MYEVKLIKKIKFIITFSILVLLLSVHNWALANSDYVIKPISLSEAFSIADKENIDIISVRKNIDLAKHDINIAKRIPNPQLQPAFGFGSVYTELPSPNSIGINQLFELGKRGPRTKVAKANYNLTNDTVKLNVFELHSSIRQSYIDLVAAKSNLVILNEQNFLLKNLVDITQKRFNAGVIPESDILEVKLILNQMATQLNQANSQVLQARYNFNLVLNSNSNNKITYDVIDIFLPSNLNYQSPINMSISGAQSSSDKIQNLI